MAPLRRLDKALWRLPRWARRLVTFPVVGALVVWDFVTEGWGHAIPAARNTWRAAMEHVDNRPGENK